MVCSPLEPAEPVVAIEEEEMVTDASFVATIAFEPLLEVVIFAYSIVAEEEDPETTIPELMP